MTTQYSRLTTAKVRSVAVIAVLPPMHRATGKATPKPRSHWAVIALKPWRAGPASLHARDA